MLDIDNYNRDQLKFIVQISDKCGRFEDMLNYMEIICQRYGNILKDEKNYLEKAIKQLISPKQVKLNTLYKIDSSSDPILTENINEEKLQIGNEIKNICHRVIILIDNSLLKYCTDRETEVFLNRLKADLNKYLSQVEEDQDKYLKLANLLFRDALNIARKHLDPLNSSHLSTVTSFARFLISFMNSKEEGVSLLNSVVYSDYAKKVFESPNSYENETYAFLDEMKKFIGNLK